MEETGKYRDLMARALVELRELKAQLKAKEQTEPVAVVGLGCRFPGGADSPEAYWNLLCGGVDAVTEVPKERWDIDAYYDPDPAVPGKMSCRCGGFLSGLDLFDASFFGITPRELTGMDPQQRLLLETAWEALEHAGQAPDALFKTPTGVFTGISSFDYAAAQFQATDIRQINAYLGTGIALSAATGRLSYILGLTGPSLAVDTACSSSLVAVHLACRSLRAGECDLALAGGVNVILLPELSINFSKAGMLSPGGRCRTFDAAADGYVRGEGCGVVVLKRISDALAAGDRIWAVIRGSAVNQDGASGGLTVPSGPAQAQVIRRALADAGVSPGEVGYLEAHGTGTLLGDPIEMGSLGKVFGGRSAADPLVVGSVKTNIGHLEAAAGIAALIKAVLALERGEIPAHLHFRTPSPHIAWRELPIVVPMRTLPWPAGKKRIAGVSSFGFTGTNAHVVLEAGPAVTGEERVWKRPVHLLALSARSEGALEVLVGRYAEHLEGHPGEAIADVCHTANTGRSHFEERAALIGSTREEILEGCRAFGAGGVRRGSGDPGKVAFLFTGQGSQYPGMGRELYETSPVFREVLERCAGILSGRLSRPLLDVLYGPGDGKELEDTAFQQPALFAVEMALCGLWKSWGIEPAWVMGHSVGEYAAACAAGVFSLEDGLHLVAERGRLMGMIGEAGAMAAVLADVSSAEEVIAPCAGVSVAAVNGPGCVVISGPAGGVEEALAEFSRQGIAFRRLKVSQAFHSVLVERILPALGDAARSVPHHQPRIGIVSNVTGRAVIRIDAEHWVRHARSPVLFQAGMGALAREGCGIFVEAGPGPALLGMGRRCVDGRIWLPSLRSVGDDWRRMVETLGDLYRLGITPDWQGFDRGCGCSKVVLPTYPFQRRRYWIERTAERVSVPASGQGTIHTLLGQRVATAHRDVIYESRLGSDGPAFLGDHRICGAAVFPGTGYVEMALAAGAELMGTEGMTIEGFAIGQPLLLTEGGIPVQTILHPEGEGYAFEISSEGSPGKWRLHATGRIRSGAEPVSAERPAAVRARCPEPLSVETHYEQLHERGIDYGPAFRRIAELAKGQGESLGRVTRNGSGCRDARSPLSAVLLDGAFQVLAAALTGADGTLVPVGFECLRVFRRSGDDLWAHAKSAVHPAGGGGADAASLTLLDGTGAVATLDGLCFRKVAAAQLLRQGGGAGLYETVWERLSPTGTGGGGVAGQWVIFADEAGLGERTARLLEAAGGRAALVYRGEGYGQSPGGRFQVNPLLPGDFRRLGTEVFGSDLRGVVHLWSLDSGERTDLESIERGKVLGCASVLHLVQALSGAGCTPRLYPVTRGAQPVIMTQAAGAPLEGLAVHQSPLWGLARVIAWEHPEFQTRCIDLDPAKEAGEETCLFRELDRPAGDPEERIARRGGLRYGARLARREQPEAGARILPDATYLITGGLGALGLRIAERLKERGAKNIVLCGRRPADPRSAETVARLSSDGVRVVVMQADVSREDEVMNLLEKIRESLPDLKGVVHAAGILADGIIGEMTWERFASVMPSKIDGAWHLQRHVQAQNLDFFILFSSTASGLGSPGQGNYAAANAFLDALAHDLRRRGCRATTINWGPWEGAGMAAVHPDTASRYRRWVRPLVPAEGLALFASIAGSDLTQVTAADIDWDAYAGRVSAGQDAAFLSRLVKKIVPGAGGSTKATVRTGIAAAAAAERSGILRAFVIDSVLRVTGHGDAGQIRNDRPLMEQGIDSLMSVELRNLLSAGLGISLPVGLLFNYPSVDDLCRHLAGLLEMDPEREGVAQERSGTGSGEDEFAYLDELDPEELEALIKKEIR